MLILLRFVCEQVCEQIRKYESAFVSNPLVTHSKPHSFGLKSDLNLIFRNVFLSK